MGSKEPQVSSSLLLQEIHMGSKEPQVSSSLLLQEIHIQASLHKEILLSVSTMP
jgi:hypothetical protein